MNGENAELRTPSRNGDSLLPDYRHERLIVLLHGWRHSPWQLTGLQCRVHEMLPGSDFFIPRLPLGFFSRADLAEESRRVARELDAHWQARKAQAGEGYREIIFIGHSAGATLARSIFLAGCGRSINVARTRTVWRWLARWPAKVESLKPQLWAEKLTRIVQLAAFNRGWSVNYLAQGFSAVAYALARWGFMLVRPIWGEHWLFQVYRGAPFLNELRLLWQEQYSLHQHKCWPWPVIVQLLGSKDALVAPDETIDLATGDEFIFLEVPFTDHFTISRVHARYAGRNPPSEEVIAERCKRISRALTEESAKLATITEIERPFVPEKAVTDVVFVVHGIRDAGFWTQHIGRAVLKHAQARRDAVRVFTPSYGYFGMGPFLLSWNRRAKAAWFVEHYIEARARYPEANISYIGHSNGTYLPVSALEQYPAVRFHRLAFAGSVLPKRLPWELFGARVGAVCNFVATSDWVVAFFPRMFEALRLSDIGSAGHAGFIANGHLAVKNICYAPGGHGVVPEEERLWPPLAEFILDGAYPKETQAPLVAGRGRKFWTRFVAANGKFPILAWVVCIGILALVLLAALGIGTLLARLLPVGGSFWHGALLVLAVLGLRFVLRRV